VGDEQFDAAETFILDQVDNAPEPVSPGALIEAAKAAPNHFPPSLITWVVWRLVTSGRLGFTPDWRVTARAEAAAR
jgi:hypothetical protein